jgi:hypothetical protein
MESPPEGSPGEVYRERRRRRPRKHRSHRTKSRVLALLTVTVLVIPVAGAWYYLYHRRPMPGRPDQQKQESKERLALVATVNKMLAQTGKDVPPSDLVVGSATLRSREGKVYLDGTLENHSSHAYPRVHIIFDAMDKGHNPAGLAEGDVNGIEPGKNTSFELGPVNSDARTCVLRSISLVH